MDDIFFGDEYYAPLSAAFESNNTFETASTITEGTHTITGSIADWYQFEAQAGPIELTMTPATGALQTLNMELRNANNQPIATNFTDSGTETITHTLPAAGTYYVRIYSAQFGDNAPAGTALDYDFTLDLPQVVAPDGNNSRGTASALSEGSHDILGREEDWHQLSATAGYMTLNMTAIELLDDPADARDNVRDLNLELRNSAGQVVRTNFSGAPSESLTHLIPEDGTYYARVYTAQFGSNAPDGTLLSYNLEVDYATPLTDDGNDSRATASSLSEGTHNISGTGQDWHRIDSPSGLLSLSMTPANDTWPDGSPVNLNMELRDSNGNSLQSNFTGSGTEAFNYVLNSEGVYYVRVYRADFPAGVENSPLEYSLTVDLPEAGVSDGNDTQETAEVLPEGTSSHTGTGVDWYRFDTLSGLMNFSMTQTGTTPTGGEMNLNMELFTAAGNSVRQNFSDTSDTESFSFLANEDGTYFLKVYWAPFPNGAPNGVEMNYTLSLDLPEANTPELNDVFATAPTLTEGTSSHTGTGVDWYRVDSLSGLMNFSMTQSSTSATGSGDPEPLNLNMELFTADGNSVRQNFSDTSDTESFSFLAGTDAPYFLKVYWAPFPNGAPNGVEMSYSLTVDLPEANTPELNDVFATAPTLTEGTSSHTGTGVDWYRFDTLSGLINYSMTQSSTPAAGSGDSEPLNLNVELFTSEGVSVSQNFSDSSNTESASYLAGTDDTYFLKVYWAPFPDGAPNGVEMSYSLNLDLPDADTPDGNDTTATARALGTGTITVEDGTGVDWHRIETGPGMMNFTMRHNSGGLGADGEVMDLNMELYNEAGEVIRGEFVEFADETFSFLATGTQTYFLKVYWAPFQDDAPNGFNLDYNLEVALPYNTWSNTLNFGPIRDASVTVYDIDNDGRDEIFIGTSKGLDAEANEVLPAGLIVLEDDGTIKWTKTFAPFPGADPLTGKTYNTTSVSTAPVFSDVNGDGTIDIVVGVGADVRGEFSPAGQPGDLGGVYAVDANGNTLWSHINKDTFGSIGTDSSNTSASGPDGRPDGTYSAPRIFDIDADGVREVLYTSWDHYLYMLNGKTGAVEREVDLHDTAGATPALADLNNDGLFELVVPADITDNAAAGIPNQGGILHVLSNYGQPNVTGWDDQVAQSTGADFRGKFEEQSLWSSPKVVDLDRNGSLEIIQGTGNFFKDERGHYVKVWNADGSLRMQLNTTGSVLASPLIADLDGDGRPEIIAATIDGFVHGWNAAGVELFATHVRPYNEDIDGPDLSALPIVRQPIAVDIDNADGDLELLVSIGSQMIILDSDGTQISNTAAAERAFSTYAGSPVAKDLDGDGILDLVTGGTNEAHDQAIVYRWENVIETSEESYRTAEYQDTQSLHNIRSFVERFYTTILGRSSDAAGSNDWTDELYTGVLTGANVARGFINSREFVNRNTTDEEFVDILYAAFFNRDADTGGFNLWMNELSNGRARGEVLDGFIRSQEFFNLTTSFGIRAQPQFGEASDAAVIVGDATDTSVLRGGAGNNVMYDEGTGVAEGPANEKSIAGQVYRLYGATLGREPDANGFQSWFNAISGAPGSTNVTLEQAAGGFVRSQEFQNTYGNLSDDAFVELLYRNVLNRPSDAGGKASWLATLSPGAGADGIVGTADDTDPVNTRANVVLGFSQSGEYQNRTNAKLDNFMAHAKAEWIDVLEGGAGNDQMNGGIGSDVFVFRNGQGGNDTIHGFEPWDELQLSGFGFNSGADARAHMTPGGGNVVFNYSGQAITFLNTTMAEMSRVRYNVS